MYTNTHDCLSSQYISIIINIIRIIMFITIVLIIIMLRVAGTRGRLSGKEFERRRIENIAMHYGKMLDNIYIYIIYIYIYTYIHTHFYVS